MRTITLSIIDKNRLTIMYSFLYVNNKTGFLSKVFLILTIPFNHLSIDIIELN